MPKKIDTAGLKHFKGKENAMIAGKSESTNTATVAHAVGEYFYWKGVLHIVTAAIAVGGTIQTNTNVKPAVLADDVSVLKESMSQYGIKTNASGELVTVKDAAENRPISNIVVDSSATSIRRCAKNLWCGNVDYSPSIGTADEITVYKNKSEIKITKVSTSLGNRLATYTQITLPPGRYYCSTPDLETDTASSGFFIYNMNGGTILTRFNKNTSSYFTLSASTTISIGISLGVNDTADGLYHILISAENASYEDYNGNDYTVTNGEVAETINTLNGLNNIWANIGNISFDYWADTKGYIDEKDTIVKALIAKELPSMIADTALTANDFRIVNNTLYRATTSIASGATLTVGTNVVATTLAEVIKPLLS